VLSGGTETQRWCRDTIEALPVWGCTLERRYGPTGVGKPRCRSALRNLSLRARSLETTKVCAEKTGVGSAGSHLKGAMPQVASRG
jgi:hypothetical protein